MLFFSIIQTEHQNLILASLHIDKFMKDVRISLRQLNMIYEGQLTSASVVST